MTRLRFSLRTLLVLTALAAAACYWWVARPTVVATQFAAAINKNDQVTAQAMILNAGQFDYPLSSMHVPIYLPTSDSEKLGSPKPLRRVQALLQPRTLRDAWHGQRRIVMKSFLTEEELNVLFSHGGGAMPFPPPSYHLVANATGVQALK